MRRSRVRICSWSDVHKFHDDTHDICRQVCGHEEGVENCSLSVHHDEDGMMVVALK